MDNKEVVICIICKDWNLGKITTKEAWRNLNEMREIESNSQDLDHYFELAEKLSEDELEKSKS